MEIDIFTICAAVKHEGADFDIIGVPGAARVLEVAKSPECTVAVQARPGDSDDLPHLCRFTVTHVDGYLVFARQFEVPPHPRDDTHSTHFHVSTFETSQFQHGGWHRLELYIDGAQTHSVPLFVFLAPAAA